jgi:ribonuclease Z
MPRGFDPTLVNDPFDDPGLYVDLVFERRALLFDVGDVAKLPTRKLLRVSDVFVTHRHMDHFAGFDQLLRRLLGREKTLGVYGPAGLIGAVEHKLKAYTWNLIGGYEGELIIRVTELDPSGAVVSARFAGRSQFDRVQDECRPRFDKLLLKEPGLQVRAAALDHGGVCVLAYALEERAQINICRNKVEALGLAVGPWLRAFKDATLRGADDATPIDVGRRSEGRGEPMALPLGLLKREIMKVASGRKIAYVVDCAFTETNQQTVIELAKDADILFIEATFLDADRAVAEARCHLTARQAGTLARWAKAKRLVTLHYSPRYRGEGRRLAEEAQQAFEGR